MILTDEIKKKIEEEYNEFKANQYAGKTKEERKALGQFFTPPVLTIKMIERFEDLNGNIVDPTVGAGGLLAACIIAGANPMQCFGIELDETIVNNVTLDRLSKLGVPKDNIIIGDALSDETYEKLNKRIKDMEEIVEAMRRC